MLSRPRQHAARWWKMHDIPDLMHREAKMLLETSRYLHAAAEGFVSADVSRALVEQEDGVFRRKSLFTFPW